jgi:hypothetical protein
VEVDLSGLEVQEMEDLLTGENVRPGERLALELPGYGYRIFGF